MNLLRFLARNAFLKIAFVLLFPLNLFSQPASPEDKDLTGVWAGFIKTSEKNLPYEIAISQVNGKLSGYSYTTFMVRGEEQVVVKCIKLRSEKGNIIIEDDSLVYDNFDEEAPRELRQTSTLSLKANGPEMIMTGKFKTKKTSSFRQLSGEIRLRKDTIVEQAKLLPKLEKLNLSNSLSFVQKEATVTASVKPPPPIPDSSLAIVEDTRGLEVKRNVFEPKSGPAKTTKSLTATKPAIKKVGIAPVRMIAKAAPAIIKPAAAVKEKPIAAVAKPVVKTSTAAATAVAKTPAQATAPPVASPVAKPKTVPATAYSTPPDLGKRSIETIQTVFFKSDSLLLTLYDNGEVDGDSVSVILNGKAILSKQGLSTNAINKTLYITPDMGDSLQMIMYAENLGSIAPNTGLLIVMDGRDRYEIRFSGDLNKNAAIIFRKRKAE